MPGNVPEMPAQEEEKKETTEGSPKREKEEKEPTALAEATHVLTVPGLEEALKAAVKNQERAKLGDGVEKNTEAVVQLANSLETLAGTCKFVMAKVAQSMRNEDQLVRTCQNLQWQITGAGGKQQSNTSMKFLLIDQAKILGEILEALGSSAEISAEQNEE